MLRSKLRQTGTGEETAFVPQACLTARKTLKTGWRSFWYLEVAGRGPCGRPHPIHVIMVLSADGHKGRTLQTSAAMMFNNVCWMRTATRVAPCKRTPQHLVIGRYIRNSNWKLHRDSLFLRFSFVSTPRFDVGESAICGWRAVRGVPLISPQTENGKGP